MDIHKPKPVHSWRDFIKEIGIIVIGVTIALTGEQLVETLNWKHKVADAETAMRREFSADLAYAAVELSMKDCAGKYFDRMEMAIKDRRADTLRQLAAMEPPFSTHPWVFESWTAAINSQIPDHMPRDMLGAYAIGFRRIMTQRERQFIMQDHYSEVMGGRFLDNPTPEVSYAQLVALGKLRREHALSMLISQVLINTDGKPLGIAPDPALRNDQAGVLASPGAITSAAACEKQLAAIAS
jgi:hypothetical protein